MEYIIVSADYAIGENYSYEGSFFGGPGRDVSYLDCKVNKAIKEGWKPLGSPFIRHGSQSGAEFYQAMVRE